MNVTYKEIISVVKGGLISESMVRLAERQSKVSNSKETRQFRQYQTDYQNTEAGNNGKSDISQISKEFPSQLPKNNESKHPAETVVKIK